VSEWPKKCAAVIPCLDEQETIATVVAGASRHLSTVLVVDDHSRDQTAERARKAGATVLAHDRTLGKGAALQTGWRRARELGFTWAVNLDGDAQHCPSDIPAFFQRAEQTSAPLVVGNRMQRADRMPPLRRWVNRWMSHRISKLAGLDLPDSQCGFRLMNLERWRDLSLKRCHFEVESEVLLAFAGAGLKVEFVPIQVIYRQHGSKIRPFPDTFRWFSWWLDARRGRAHEPQ
jgi:glycosyltransferase involved in cell wall biosynthesis